MAGCTFLATHISYDKSLPVPIQDKAVTGGRPTLLGKPGGLWFAKEFGWVDLLQKKKTWDVTANIGADGRFPYTRPFYDAVFSGTAVPNATESDTFIGVPAEVHYTYRFCLDGKLESDINSPGVSKVFHLTSANEAQFHAKFMEWAGPYLLGILKNKTPWSIVTPFEHLYFDDITKGPAGEYLRGLGVLPDKISEPCKYFYRNYIVRAVITDILLAADPAKKDEILKAASLLPLAASTMASTGLTCRILENAPKSTPKVLCGADGNVCSENIEALAANTKAKYKLRPDWKSILAPTGADVPTAYNIIINATLGKFYMESMSATWGGIYFDESLFTTPAEVGSWKYYLEVPSGCLWRPVSVVGEDVFKTPTILAWASSQAAADSMLPDKQAYIAGVTTGRELRMFRTPTQAAGRFRGRTFRRKPMRMNKNGGRPSRKSKHRIGNRHA